MTVIVYRDGVLAADTGAFMGNIIVGNVHKLHRTPRGVLVACAGNVPDVYRFRKWADRGFLDSERPEKTQDFGALTVAPDGEITKYTAEFHPYPVASPYAVEGCAEEFLWALLLVGKTAAQCVRMAIEHNCYAAGRVETMELNTQ